MGKRGGGGVVIVRNFCDINHSYLWSLFITSFIDTLNLYGGIPDQVLIYPFC